MTEMRSDRINSFTGLRAAAMLTVFCSHLSYLRETPFHGLYSLIDNGRFGVNFFLVLSGFVLSLGYSHKLYANSMIRDILFLKRRVSIIYIPYIITMILAIPLHILDVSSGGELLNGKSLMIRLLLNAGVIQSAIPFSKYSVSINGVSWFVSTLFVIYMFTPGLLRLNNRTANHYSLFKSVLLTGTILFFYGCSYMVIREIEYVRFADSGLSIIYINPLIRLFPFLIGIMGYNIFGLLSSYQIRNSSFIEAAGIAVFFLWWITANKTGLPTVATECADMIVSMFVVLVFALSRDGIVSDFLSRKRMLGLGHISLEFYLVHYLVIRYGMITAKHFDMDHGIAISALTILFFVLSLCGACLIHFISDRLLKRDS